MRRRRIGLCDSTGALPANLQPNRLPEVGLDPSCEVSHVVSVDRFFAWHLYRSPWVAVTQRGRNAAGPAGAVRGAEAEAGATRRCGPVGRRWEG